MSEATKILRIGRTLGYELAHEYLNSGGTSGLPVIQFSKECYRVPRWALMELAHFGAQNHCRIARDSAAYRPLCRTPHNPREPSPNRRRAVVALRVAARRRRPDRLRRRCSAIRSGLARDYRAAAVETPRPQRSQRSRSKGQRPCDQ